MNITASYIRRKLQGRYDPREAGNLSRIICCEILGQQTVDYYLGKDIILSVKEEQELESILARLHNFEPIQYILGLSLIHISEPTRQAEISYAVFCLKKKKPRDGLLSRIPTSA